MSNLGTAINLTAALLVGAATASNADPRGPASASAAGPTAMTNVGSIQTCFSHARCIRGCVGELAAREHR